MTAPIQFVWSNWSVSNKKSATSKKKKAVVKCSNFSENDRYESRCIHVFPSTILCAKRSMTVAQIVLGCSAGYVNRLVALKIRPGTPILTPLCPTNLEGLVLGCFHTDFSGRTSLESACQDLHNTHNFVDQNLKMSAFHDCQEFQRYLLVSTPYRMPMKGCRYFNRLSRKLHFFISLSFRVFINFYGIGHMWYSSRCQIISDQMPIFGIREVPGVSEQGGASEIAAAQLDTIG